MKTKWKYAAAVSAILFHILEAVAADPKGLLIYSEPPTTYANLCEFRFLDTAKPLYFTVIRADGTKLQLPSDVMMIVVDYPPQNLQTDIQGLANLNLGKIPELIHKFPQFKAQLMQAQEKWENALEVSKQQQKQRAATETAEAATTTITLEVGGTNYEGVALSSVEGETVGIIHSSGVAKLALEQLTKEQIVALNTTSTSLHIDPGWLAKKQKIDGKQKIVNNPEATSTPNVSTSAAPFMPWPEPSPDAPHALPLGIKTTLLSSLLQDFGLRKYPSPASEHLCIFGYSGDNKTFSVEIYGVDEANLVRMRFTPRDPSLTYGDNISNI